MEREGKLEAAKGEMEKASRMIVDIDSDPISGRAAQALALTRIAALDKAITEKKVTEAQRIRGAAGANPQSAKTIAGCADAKAGCGARHRHGAPRGARIGNSNYQSASALANPKGDAEAIGAALTAVGFNSVTVRHDLDRRNMLAALREFEIEAERADWAVVYYAGHGIEIGGINYLIPVDAALTTDRVAGDEAVPLERVIVSLQQTKKLRLIVLDACRDNPFVSKMKRLFTRAGGKGLADIEPDGGVVVAYAARGGQVAFDGPQGQRSPFVAALLTHIKTPRLDLGSCSVVLRMTS